MNEAMWEVICNRCRTPVAADVAVCPTCGAVLIADRVPADAEAPADPPKRRRFWRRGAESETAPPPDDTAAPPEVEGHSTSPPVAETAPR